MEERKKDHIELAFESQISKVEVDQRFYYEPVTGAHLDGGLEPFDFLGKSFRIPLWVSSMTGGTKLAHKINHNLARACNEFGFGMGLGSCRILMEDEKYLPDFDVRDTIGKDQVLFANLGIAQLEELYNKNNLDPAKRLVDTLRADGIIIHVNPMQESMQPEGDLLKVPPLEVIAYVAQHLGAPVIVKEVGQGMGPESLRSLVNLPIAAIDFAAFGGTNFARLELMRSEPLEQEFYGPFAYIGHDAYEMVSMLNHILDENHSPACKQVIISGGIKSFLDGYYLINKCKLPAIYGQASAFLKYAREDYDQLKRFIEYQIRGLELASAFLTIK